MNIFIVLPTQLFKQKLPDKYDKIYIIEHPYYFTRFNFHKLKLAFLKSAMENYYKILKKQFKNIEYIKFNEYNKNLFIDKNCYMYNPIDIPVINEFEKFNTTFIESPMFLLNESDRPSKQIKRHSSFYNFSKNKIKQKYNIDFTLFNNLDNYNRNRIPKEHIPEDPKLNYKNSYKLQSINYINKYFSKNPGNLTINELNKLPTTHLQAEKHLTYFLKNNIHKFGVYQDFISKNESVLYHSNISYLINIGLLTPLQILKQIKYYNYDKDIKNSNVEGFIRQIIGWREYMYYIYSTHYNQLIKSNFWGNTKKINWDIFYGYKKSGIDIIDTEIKKIKNTAWAHHIVRLMVFLNYFILSRIRKEDIYRWFISFVALDAYDWVMVSNIYAMGYFSKEMTSKPYISSSNYLIKMSDYPKKELKEKWDPIYHKFMDSVKTLKFYGKNLKNNK